MATLGLKGNLLPLDEEDFQMNRAHMKCIACIACEELFTAKNVHSELGWRETQISGMCEDCFDGLFA